MHVMNVDVRVRLCVCVVERIMRPRAPLCLGYGGLTC